MYKKKIRMSDARCQMLEFRVKLRIEFRHWSLDTKYQCL